MRNVRRKKEAAVAAATAILTSTAVAVGKRAGADVVAAFVAGAGAAATVGFVVITNIRIKHARSEYVQQHRQRSGGGRLGYLRCFRANDER